MCRFSTAYTNIWNLFLIIKRHTAWGYCQIFFDLVLTCLISAPHTTDESRFIFCNILKFFVIMCIPDMCIRCAFARANISFWTVSNSSGIFVSISSRETSIFSLVSLRTTTHLFAAILSVPVPHEAEFHASPAQEFPSRTLIGIVQFCTADFSRRSRTSFALSNTPSFCIWIGITITCVGAT